MFSWLQFLTYAIITAITPGPNNIMSLSNASRVGFTKALPFNFGMLLGSSLVMMGTALLSSLSTALFPSIQKGMLVVGFSYMLYLAWKIFKSPADINEEDKNTIGFGAALGLQFVNPKAYIYGIVSMQIYILPHYQGNNLTLAGFAFLLAAMGFAATLCWSAFGSIFKLLFSRHAKITNTVMALLLVGCAISLLR